MNRLICSISFLVLSSIGFSQKTFFVYIQSEAEQPFFARINDKNISSSSSGYIILSQLKDSVYNFKIGFPQNRWPEQDFSIAIRSGDHGFLLKNFNEKGWGLFDLQTLSVVMSGKKESAKVRNEPQAVSLFTEVLSKAANDPSLREKPVFAVVKEEKSVSPESVVRQEIPVKEKELQQGEKEKLTAAVDTSRTTEIVINTESKSGISKKVNPAEDPSKLSQEGIQGQAIAKEKQPEKKDTSSTALSPVVKNVEDKVDSANKTPETVVKDKTKTEALKNVKQKEEALKLPQDSAQLEATVKETQPKEKEPVSTPSVAKNLEEATVDTTSKIVAKEETRSSKTETIQPQTTYSRRSVVQKKSESSSLEGLGLVFIDQYPGGEKDTISIMIPNITLAFRAEKENTLSTREKKFLNIDDSKENVSSLATKKTNCKVVASQNDFLKLRKKMAGQNDDEAMLTEAKKGI